jgi:hypothetical protein
VNIFGKMLARNMLTMTCMCRRDIVASYLMKLVELRDQLGEVGDKFKVDEIVWIILNVFSSSRHAFVKVI